MALRWKVVTPWTLALAAIAIALSVTALRAQSGKIEVQWLGNATFKITGIGGKVIVIDPYLTAIRRRRPSSRTSRSWGKAT